VQVHEIFRKFVQMHIDVAAKVLYFLAVFEKTEPLGQWGGAKLDWCDDPPVSSTQAGMGH
jgi:hypothetical protein